MKHIKTGGVRSMFKIIAQTRSLQAAVMVLKPGGESSDQIEDEHPHAEQWLVVLSGSGVARFKGRSVKIAAGSVLLIEKNEPHQIRNTGRTLLRTVNFYSPPAYDNDGEVTPVAARRNKRQPD